MAFRPKLHTRKSVVTGPRAVIKVTRNEPCPCGSGQKYKDCHEKAGDAFLQKLAAQRRKDEAKALRARLKAEGVPFFKRLFVRP